MLKRWRKFDLLDLMISLGFFIVVSVVMVPWVVHLADVILEFWMAVFTTTEEL